MAYQTIEVRKLTPSIGAEIFGVDLARPLGNQQFQEVHDALMENLVIFFRDQELSHDQHKDFGRRFGELHMHPTSTRTDWPHPEILIIKADENSKYIAGEEWHSDVSCDPEPPMGSILYMKKLPPDNGGNTLFANMYRAFETLSAPIQRLCEGLTAVHDGAQVYGGRFGQKPKEGGFPRSEHPVVRTHPMTGRKALFVNRNFTTRIAGLRKHESDALLEMLYRHSETPEFQCRFAWRPNSIAFWVFAALGGIFSEKSGVVNIGLEGMMVIGAFFAVYGSYTTGSPAMGILFGVIAGGILGLIHAVLSIHLRADQVISGTAINLFSTALASFLIFKLFGGKGGQTDIVTGLSYNIPDWIKNIPIIGNLISQLNWFVILAIILVFVSHYILYKTPLGLRIRAVGEHPKAADTLGINVYKIRYLCVILSGMLAGLGGAALSLGITPLYREGMVAGRGFIALAAVIFGNWKPFGALGASLLFAFGSAFNIFAQGLSWNLPTEVYDVIPYVLTMIALAGFVGKTTGPLASGKPYVKGSR